VGASPSKVINTALEIWRDDVNAKSGLLGRPVELVIYDDQSSPANVPNIYTKLITVDKVDLLLGPCPLLIPSPCTAWLTVRIQSLRAAAIRRTLMQG
jgi:Periplasmic binding protein